MLRHLPNALCVLRMLLAVPVALLLVQGKFALTMYVFGVAAVTDALDGYLAKRFDWTSELGKALDPLADKILLVTSFVTLTAVGRVPIWLAVPVVLRDVVITVGAITFLKLFGPLTDARPTIISKLNTLVQIGYVLVIIIAAAWGQSLKIDLNVPIVVLATLVIVTTVASGIDYIATYIQRAMSVARARQPR